MFSCAFYHFIPISMLSGDLTVFWSSFCCCYTCRSPFCLLLFSLALTASEFQPSWFCLCILVWTPPWAAVPAWGCSCRGPWAAMSLQATSAAAPWALPWLLVEICSALCSWAAGGQPAPSLASPGLWGAAAPHLEHLLCSFCPDLGAPRAVSCFLTLLSQLQSSLFLS